MNTRFTLRADPCSEAQRNCATALMRTIQETLIDSELGGVTGGRKEPSASDLITAQRPFYPDW
jgi:hypothetical protein